MASSYTWAFTESYLGKNEITSSYENQNDIFFRKVNDNNSLTRYDQGGYVIQQYDDLAVLDLNSVHAPDASFTIEFSVKEIGDTLYTEKAVNYLTFGYHIRGRSGVTVTLCATRVALT